jgi:hypothetical protein
MGPQPQPKVEKPRREGPRPKPAGLSNGASCLWDVMYADEASGPRWDQLRRLRPTDQELLAALAREFRPDTPGGAWLAWVAHRGHARLVLWYRHPDGGGPFALAGEALVLAVREILRLPRARRERPSRRYLFDEMALVMGG